MRTWKLLALLTLVLFFVGLYFRGGFILPLITLILVVIKNLKTMDSKKTVIVLLSMILLSLILSYFNLDRASSHIGIISACLLLLVVLLNSRT